QLALAAADVRHRVDRLDAGLERFLHRLAVDHARGLELERPALRGFDRRTAVEGLAERVDDAPDQRLTDRNARDASGPLHTLALFDMLPLAEEGDADVVLLEIEGVAGDSVLELEHLHRDRGLQSVEVRDAVPDLENSSDLREVGLDVVLLDPLSQDGCDLFGT